MQIHKLIRTSFGKRIIEVKLRLNQSLMYVLYFLSIQVEVS